MVGLKKPKRGLGGSITTGIYKRPRAYPSLFAGIAVSESVSAGPQSTRQGRLAAWRIRSGVACNDALSHGGVPGFDVCQKSLALGVSGVRLFNQDDLRIHHLP